MNSVLRMVGELGRPVVEGVELVLPVRVVGKGGIPAELMGLAVEVQVRLKYIYVIIMICATTGAGTDLEGANEVPTPCRRLMRPGETNS